MMKDKCKYKQTAKGMIPEEWVIKTIDELGGIVTGKTPKTAIKENFGKEYPFITPRDMKGQKYVRETERYLSYKGMMSIKNCRLPKNAICVSCIGSDMGKVTITTKDSLSNQQINSVIPNISTDFVYYALLYNSAHLKNMGKQSTAVPILNKSQFSRIEIALPSDKGEIESIARILSSFDSKIEINQRYNKVLEEIGQTVFKHWFIDFEFPDKNGRPYKSRGGEMIDSELGDIPKGWKVGKLRELLECIKKPLKAGDTIKGRYYVPIDCLPMKNLGLRTYLPHTEAKSSLIGFEKDDILIGAMRIYFHRVCVAPFTGVTRTTSFVLRPRVKEHLCYSLLLLNRNETIEYANMHSKGSTMPYAVWDGSLAEMKIVIPNSDILNEFNSLYYQLLEKMRDSIHVNMRLEKIRDLLLLELMSGKIRVPVEARV